MEYKYYDDHVVEVVRSKPLTIDMEEHIRKISAPYYHEFKRIEGMLEIIYNCASNTNVDIENRMNMIREFAQTAMCYIPKIK